MSSDTEFPDEAELRSWAEAHEPAGYHTARLVLSVLDRLAAQRALNVALAERVLAQSGLLSKRAEGAQ